MPVETAAAPIRVTDAAWESIEGGYDLQVHVAPDVIGRRIDDLDLAKEFASRKLKGFVLKSHYAPTYERAKVVTKASQSLGITAFGAQIMQLPPDYTTESHDEADTGQQGGDHHPAPAGQRRRVRRG